MAFNCNCIDVALSLFIIPFLVFGLPDFALPTFATGEWPIEVKIRKAAVSIDVRELARVGYHR
jgi:hypothetical protein